MTKYQVEYLALGNKNEQENLENYIIRSFIICALHIILLWLLNQGGYDT
jgi:hypothetical protein